MKLYAMCHVRFVLMGVMLVRASLLSGAVGILRIEPDSKLTGDIKAFRLDAQMVHADSFGEPRAFECAVAGDCRVELPAGIWVFSSGDPRIYLKPRSETLLEPPGPSPIIPLRAFRTVPVSGTVERPSKVDSISVHFRRDGEAALDDQVSCPVVERRFQCQLPIGRWDLRVRIPGHASEYRWGISLQIGSNDLGKLRFRPGASIIGRVAADDEARLKMKEIRVVLTPAATLRTADERAGVRRIVTVSEKGYFQFEGTSPGEYIIGAKVTGLVSETQRITVIADRETELRRPILVGRPKRVTVTVVPPVDQHYQQWRVSLGRHVDRNRVEPVTESMAEINGDWAFTSAWPGPYTISVRDSKGNEWAWKDIEIGSEGTHLIIPIVSTPLRGELFLGDKPIGGRVTFQSAAAEIVMDVADDGKFTGHLTSDQNETWDIRIDSAAFRITRALRAVRPDYSTDGASISLRLPVGHFGGRVVDETGAPALHGLVNVASLDGTETVMQATVEDDGQFTLNGLPTGSYKVTAEVGAKAGPKTSDAIIVNVDDAGGPDDLMIVVRPSRRAIGRVISQGSPVVGARVALFPTDRNFVILAPATTDSAGRFSIFLPPGTKEVDAIVDAVGFATRVMYKRLSDSEIIVGLGQVGGELQLVVPAWQDGPTKQPWVIHDGGISHALGLARTIKGDQTLQIDAGMVDAGSYTLCFATQAQLPHLRAGMSAAIECQSGIVPPYGRLVLTVSDK